MTENRTKIYLNYLADAEKQKMTDTMSFLRGGNDGKNELIAIASDLYGEGIQLDFSWDNGHYPSEWRANYCDKHFYTIIQFEQKHLTEKAISVLGKCDEWDWRYFYAISLCREDRKLYVISYSNRCSPNWNQEYSAQRFIELSTIDFPLLTENGVIYRMDDALHTAINDRLAAKRPMFVEEEGNIVMTVRDQHGNYADIKGTSLDSVFRDYADNYTGYRNYRRQMASEWEIVSEVARERFEEWKKTAKGLKSDFDKFYGGGIVD